MSWARVCVTNQSRTLLICVVKPSSCSCGVHAPPGGTVKPQNDGGMAKSSAAMERSATVAKGWVARALRAANR